MAASPLQLFQTAIQCLWNCASMFQSLREKLEMDSHDLPQTAQLANRDKSFLNRLLVVICMSLLTMTFAVAQGTRGTIRGTVKDPNGAVVAGASVKLTDIIKGTDIRTVE